MFAFVVSCIFFMVFNISDIFLNHLFLIISTVVGENELVVFLSSNISWINELTDDYYDRTDYCNQGQWFSCSVKHSCADLCVAYSHVP